MMRRVFAFLTGILMSLSLCSCMEKPEVSASAPPPSEGDISPVPSLATVQPTPAEDSLTTLRQVAAGYDCAVAYVGYVEEVNAEAVRECVAASPVAEDYAFLKELSEEPVVIGGCDVYCIVPTEPAATISISELEYDEELTAHVSQPRYEGEGPVLLVCNFSDILPNSLVTVCTGDQMLEFSPYISLKDGTLATTGPEKAIYDFSNITPNG